MGHGREMALGSNVTLRIEARSLPVMEGALEAIALGAIPGGLRSNREFAECLVFHEPGRSVPDDLRTLSYDPQTSGGILIAIAESHAAPLLQELKNSGLRAERIGAVVEPLRQGGKIWAIQLV